MCLCNIRCMNPIEHPKRLVRFLLFTNLHSPKSCSLCRHVCVVTFEHMVYSRSAYVFGIVLFRRSRPSQINSSRKKMETNKSVLI